MSLDKDGYDSQTITVKTSSTAPAAATSKDITPDYVGRVIDVQGGANLIHVPNPIIVKLDKTRPEPVILAGAMPDQDATDAARAL